MLLPQTIRGYTKDIDCLPTDFVAAVTDAPYELIDALRG
jgi:hypothetical protein